MVYSKKYYIYSYSVSGIVSIVGTMLILILLNHFDHTSVFNFIYKLAISFTSGGLIGFVFGLALANYFILRVHQKKINDVELNGF